MLVELEIFPVRIIGIGPEQSWRWSPASCRCSSKMNRSLMRVEACSMLSISLRRSSGDSSAASCASSSCTSSASGLCASSRLSSACWASAIARFSVSCLDAADRRLPGRQFPPDQQRQESRTQAGHQNGRAGIGDLGGKSFHGEAPDELGRTMPCKALIRDFPGWQLRHWFPAGKSNRSFGRLSPYSWPAAIDEAPPVAQKPSMLDDHAHRSQPSLPAPCWRSRAA